MTISVFQAVLIGIIATLISMSAFPLFWLSQNIMGKPLICAWFIGLILGDMSKAMEIGCVIQSAYIGQMAIGGVSTLPNINLSLWFALPLTMAEGGDAASCLTLCLAFVPVNTMIGTIGNMFKVGILHRQDAVIEAAKNSADIKKAVWYPWLGHIWTVGEVMFSVVTMILVGQGLVNAILNALPSQINGIMSTFTALLPSIGFMTLMVSLLHTGWQWIYFLFGFTAYKSLGWSTLSITFVGALVAYLIYQFTPGKKTVEVVEVESEEEEL